MSETAGTTLSVGNRAGLTAVRPLWITSITYLRNNPELDTPVAFEGSRRLIIRIHLSQPQYVQEHVNQKEGWDDAALYCELRMVEGSLKNSFQDEETLSL